MRSKRRGVRVGLVLLALLPVASTQTKIPPGAGESPPASPEVLFKDLFAAVQTDAIYPDGKTFVDAVPKEAPVKILAQYHSDPPSSPQALQSFVAAHFTLPAEAASGTSPPEKVSI